LGKRTVTINSDIMFRRKLNRIQENLSDQGISKTHAQITQVIGRGLSDKQVINKIKRRRKKR